ncbi:MAG: D-alanyl-D-alanine carboxypeptidase [Clostridia bacterium]|nr:D-alanyl-D-alanine carboxypeptidase [Clostridia bacterium]
MKRLLACFFALIFLLTLPLPCYAEGLSVSAKSAILMDASTGQVLYQKNAFVRMPMASTTKIMTALVAIESFDLEKEIEVSPDATGIEGSSIYLYPNERLTMEALLYALMLESANDAATAIAIAVAGDTEAFAEKMNQKAEALELCDTHFENPHGLDGAEHYTTAYDLAKLTSYALSNQTFLKICSTYKMKIPLNTDEGVRVLVNHNKMLHLYDGAIGVKTGFTKKSGRCLVSAAEREGLRLVAVTLSAPDDWDDHKAMLDFGFSRYVRKTFAQEGKYSVSLPVVNGKGETVTAVNSDALSATLKKEHGEITYRIEAPRFLYAPVKKGDVVGKVVCVCDGKEVATSDLVASESINTAARNGFFAWLLSIFGK